MALPEPAQPGRSRESYRVVLGSQTATAIADEDLLTAVLRHRIQVPYGCRHGNCGRCSHLLIEGDVEELPSSPYALSDPDRANGMILLCCSYACSDLIIGPAHADGVVDDVPIIPPVERSATVLEVTALPAPFAGLRVRLDTALAFRPGQYVELALADTNSWRSYSVATTPSALPHLEFLVSRWARGRFSSLLDQFRAGDQVDVRGPFGSMCLRDGGRPALMVASDVGIAPVIAMLRDAVERSFAPPITFVYGVSANRFTPFADVLSDVASSLNQFRFLVSMPDESSGVPRVSDLLHIASRSVSDPDEFDAYICGNPDLCDALTAMLEAKGLPSKRIWCERFYPGDSSSRLPV